MKYLTVALLTISIAALAVVFYGSVMSVQADDQPPLSETHKKRIATNCTSATSSLRQLHRSDASLRVNRGQMYEYIGTKLMAHLNSRLVVNRLDGGKLVDEAARYDRALTNFRATYRIYEQQLSAVLRIDCKKQPEAFYYGVADVRRKRADVYEQTTNLNRIVDDYYEGFKKFSTEYKAAVRGVTND